MINAAAGLGRGLFGRRQQYGTPGYGDPASATPAPMQAPAYERPTTGQFIAGTIGDALQSWAGGRPTFAPAMQARQNAAMEQAQYQREQADKFAAWKQQYDYQRANPAPTSPYRWESNDGSLMEVGEDGQPRTVYKDPTPKINWIRADNGDGTFQMVPVGPQGPLTQQPTADQGFLKTLPPGAKPIGGATPRASGGFPVR